MYMKNKDYFSEYWVEYDPKHGFSYDEDFWDKWNKFDDTQWKKNKKLKKDNNKYDEIWLKYDPKHWLDLESDFYFNSNPSIIPYKNNNEIIDVNSELEKYFNKSKKRKKIFSYREILSILIIFVLWLPIILSLLMRKSYEYIDDIYNISEPTQIKSEWETKISSRWLDINLKFVAEYEIQWKVISTVDYIWVTPENNLWPRDLVIWWGELSKEENISKFTWQSAINRFVYLRYNWTNEKFLEEYPNWYPFDQFSNNHVIPSSYKIRLMLNKIKKWDVIKLKWYLVNASWTEWKYNHYRNSSTSRTDNWLWACEVIYVTDVFRLKQNNI